MEQHLKPPSGKWIMLGFGRFGQSLAETFIQVGLPVSVIAQDSRPESTPSQLHWIQNDGSGTEALLQRAGIQEAVGILATTADDLVNLSAAYAARQLKPDLFVMVRQNSMINQSLFAALQADLMMVPSEVIAHECLAVLTTPLLKPFLETLRKMPETWCTQLLEELVQDLGPQAPHVWSLKIDEQQTPALFTALRHGQSVHLEELLIDHTNRSEKLPCKVLQLHRSGSGVLLTPTLDTRLQIGDELLLAGRHHALKRLALAVQNGHTLAYVLTGREGPEGWIWQ